jgi:mannose-6-phosphate isomerase-like protein (cupin superfamily)
MEKHNINEIASRLKEPFKRVMVGQVDDYCVFLVRIEGSYLFHQHPKDEMYLVLEGEVAIDQADGSSVILREGDTTVARAGEKHRSRSDEGAVVLIFKDRACLRGKTALDRVKEAIKSNLPF